jgi:hypothetical protein
VHTFPVQWPADGPDDGQIITGLPHAVDHVEGCAGSQLGVVV